MGRSQALNEIRCLEREIVQLKVEDIVDHIEPYLLKLRDLGFTNWEIGDMLKRNLDMRDVTAAATAAAKRTQDTNKRKDKKRRRP